MQYSGAAAHLHQLKRKSAMIKSGNSPNVIAKILQNDLCDS